MNRKPIMASNQAAGRKTRLAAALLLGLALAPAGAQSKVAPKAQQGLTGMWTLNQADFDRRETPPYTAEAMTLHKQREAEVEGGKVISDEGLKCLPQGMPGMMLSEFAIEILETPQRVTIISESSPLVRSVYLNRTKPTEGLEPMWNGYSLGHWEGQTLVIKTSNFNDRPFPLGFGGAIHAPTTTLTERLSLTDGGKTMVDEMTMEDARYLTRPFTLVRHFTRQPADAELWEYACEINAKGWSERFVGDKDAANPAASPKAEK